jgi:hypothetical protein
VTVLDRKCSQLTRRDGQSRRVWVNPPAQFWSDFRCTYTVTGGSYQVLTPSQMTKQVAQASIRQDEICVEKDLPVVRHRRTEVAETAMQCMG